MNNKEIQNYTLPSGAEIEFETILEHKTGASDVSYNNKDASLLFEKVIEPLGEIADVLFSKVKSSINEPDSMTLEFSASIKGKTKLIIVSGEGQGSIKISLTWNKSTS
jgi:hypothetical protein